MSAQTAADLRAAADVLRRDGWTQHTFTDEQTGCHCAAGALAEAIPTPGTDGRWMYGIEALARQVGVAPFPTSVYGWNDHPDRTADEVIAALEAAATTAEQATQGHGQPKDTR